jgi:uncharacterized membrane protein YgcG
MTLHTLHLSSTEVAHTVKWDPSSGTQIADIPATKAITDQNVLMCIFLHFRHAMVVAALLSEDDLHELGTFVTERLYTRSRTDAVESTIRKLLYTLDMDKTGSLTLTSLVMTRAPMELLAEENRFATIAPQRSTPKKGGSSGGSKAGNNSRSSGGGASSGGGSSQQCFNWAKGQPCAASALRKDGSCRFAHVCGTDLGGGLTCKEHHRPADHP